MSTCVVEIIDCLSVDQVTCNNKINSKCFYRSLQPKNLIKDEEV